MRTWGVYVYSGPARRYDPRRLRPPAERDDRAYAPPRRIADAVLAVFGNETLWVPLIVIAAGVGFVLAYLTA